MANGQPVLLTETLREVSRSFYHSMRWLPGRIRTPISLAYLLARITDTIADTAALPVDRRLVTLRSYGERIQNDGGEKLNWAALVQSQAQPAEGRLLQRAEDALSLLSTLSLGDRTLVRQVLHTIVSGQQLDLERFAGGTAANVIALQTDAELDDYTYRVAGCVGEFWTRLCLAHLQPAPPDEPWLLAQGVRFGKGLQLVNILRDLPGDLRQGRCYLPSDRLTSAGLRPADLLEPANEPRLRPVYDGCLAACEEHLRAGWAYTNAWPFRHLRLRLACALPLLLGAETARLLHRVNVLDPKSVRKVPRSQLKGMVVRLVAFYPFPGRWKRLLP